MATPGMYVPQPIAAQPKKTNGCLIAFIIVLVIFLLVGGGITAFVVYAVNTAGSAIKDGLSTVTSITVTVPSSEYEYLGPIDPTAQSYITKATTASDVDTDYKPVDSKSIFNGGDKVYITATYEPAKKGYAKAKIYQEGKFILESDPLDIPADTYYAYFSFTSEPTTDQGSWVAALYWCNTSSCSNAVLAKTLPFTII